MEWAELAELSDISETIRKVGSQNAAGWGALGQGSASGGDSYYAVR